MKILTGKQMGRVDRLTVERCGIPYLTLMETAGVRVTEALLEHLAGGDARCQYLIVCGKGNNGGDGAVVARHLWLRRAGEVSVLLVGCLEDMRGEARTNMKIVQTLAETEVGLSFHEVQRSDELTGWAGGDRLVIIDALFGTGLSRPVTGLAAEMIGMINLWREGGARVLSIDLPSGLDADRGELIEPSVRADLTVAFTAPKLGNILAPAAESNGRLIVAGIGSPDWVMDEVVRVELEGIDSASATVSALELIEEAWVRQWLVSSRRLVTAHKGAVGDVLLVAGMAGRTGAAALAAGAVLRSGAGLVTVATPSSALPLLVAQADNEVMTVPLPESPTGGIGMESLKVINGLAASRDVLAIGPGIESAGAESRRLVRELVETRSQPMVIDADGLNALAPWPLDLCGSDQLPIVITPHPGEMARLLGVSIAAIQADRIVRARELAQRNRLIVVLKGARTIIAVPTGDVFINPTGNEGMATAGSGDILTGLIAGLLAQRPILAFEAVRAGVWLHGLAGDLAASRHGKRSMIASHICDHLGQAILITGGLVEGRK
jgi:ADP-dependent NAD(P)H-hydrate dehydratase / NAD(P)H-hydrate epimerase